MNPKTFIRYLLIPIIKPVRNTELLIADKSMIRYSSLVLLFVGVLYTLTVAIAAIKGIQPIIEPFIPISKSNYYFYEIFFTIPLFFVMVVTFAGIVRFLAEFWGGKGTFEKIFSIYSIYVVLPLLLTMWIPETILILLKDANDPSKVIFIPAVIDISRQVFGVLWPLIITILGIKKIEKINYFKSIIITLLAFMPYSVLLITYIR